MVFTHCSHLNASVLPEKYSHSSHRPASEKRCADTFLNRCQNVAVRNLGIRQGNAEVDLYVVEEWAAGCNSLRPPDVSARTTRTPVQVTRLDDWSNGRKIGSVGFVKLDVEGAEFDACRGAEGFLTRTPRPVILAEIQDVRTAPWGYRAKRNHRVPSQKRFRWFSITPAGALEELDLSKENFDGNFVAIPEELGGAGIHIKPQLKKRVWRVKLRHREYPKC